jgi:hypothetical protein
MEDNAQQPQDVSQQPQPQPEVTPPAGLSMPVMQPQPAVVGKNPGSKNKLIALIVLGVVLVAAMAYGAYAYISNTPDVLLQTALSNLTKQKSFAAQYTITSGTGASATVKGDFATTSDSANSKNGEALIGIGSGADRLSLSLLSLDGTLYLKAMNAEGLVATIGALGGADSGPYIAQFRSVLKNLDNQWFELSKSEIQSMVKDSGNETVNGSISPADLQKVSDIYRQHQFIKPDKTFADQTINGKKCAHFSIKVDQQQEIAFMQAVKAANLATIKITDTEIDDVKKNNPMQDTAMEVWIARDSHTLEQAKFASTKKDNHSSMTVTMTGTLPTFDKFQKPANVRPFSDIWTILFGSTVAPVPTTVSPAGLL